MPRLTNMRSEAFLFTSSEIGKENKQEKIIRIMAIIIIIICPLALLLCFKVVKEYKRAVILRFGRVRADSPAGPGIIWVVPCTDSVILIDLRTRSINLTPQRILTKDYVTVTLGVVISCRVYKPLHCLLNVASHTEATELLAVSLLRNIVCRHTLTDLLVMRESLSRQVMTDVGKATADWGVTIEEVEIKDIILPVELQKAMAAESESRRTANSKLIECEGEVRTAEHLKAASAIMAKNPNIMLLRYLQTLNVVASKKATSVLFPLPLQIPELPDGQKPEYHAAPNTTDTAPSKSAPIPTDSAAPVLFPLGLQIPEPEVPTDVESNGFPSGKLESLSDYDET